MRTPHCSRCCGLCLEITSLLLRFASETWRSRRRPVPCLFSHHRRKRSSGARAEEPRDSDSSSLHLCGQPFNTHARPGWLWQRRSSGSEATGTRVTVPCSWKVEVGKPDLHVKNFQQKKPRPPARKNLSHVSRSRDLFCLALWSFKV